MTNIADKIRKIIAKADSTTNPEEADVFMAKAHKLLEAHGLDLLDLGKLDSDDPIGVDEHCNTVSRSYSCATLIANELARYYGCQLVTTKRRGADTKLSVAGRESARVTFQLMFPFVFRQTRAVAAQGYNAGHYKNRMQALNYVGNALALRLAKLNRMEDTKRAAQPQGSGLNALVPVDLVTQAMNAHFDDLTEGRARSVKTNTVSKELANSISLNRAAPAPTSAKRLAHD